MWGKDDDIYMSIAFKANQKNDSFYKHMTTTDDKGNVLIGWRLKRKDSKEMSKNLQKLLSIKNKKSLAYFIVKPEGREESNLPNEYYKGELVDIVQNKKGREQNYANKLELLPDYYPKDEIDSILVIKNFKEIAKEDLLQELENALDSDRKTFDYYKFYKEGQGGYQFLYY
ncbi:hypothetical protein JFL43_20835 [Viridibacillus sp. YIM B01967]|uniref:Uncharacterized protein n=1 Tax=Viridibacillus soli TaxID=2798301 RepID=A0ABS1HD18_9BACL|nr:hypothetical protein [Viridibacillus soli]MBK3497226.1 hypothetical protein [Viridibacillus soli]